MCSEGSRPAATHLLDERSLAQRAARLPDSQIPRLSEVRCIGFIISPLYPYGSLQQSRACQPGLYGLSLVGGLRGKSWVIQGLRLGTALEDLKDLEDPVNLPRSTRDRH